MKEVVPPPPSEGLFSAFERLTGTIARWLSFVAALALALTTLLLALSSILRYVASSPLSITDEFVGFLLVCIAFLGVNEGFLKGRQIRLVFLWNVLSTRARAVARLLGELLSLLVLAVILRETWSFASFSLEIGAASPVANIPEWPFMMIIPFSILGLIVSLVVSIVSRIRAGTLAKKTDIEKDQLV